MLRGRIERTGGNVEHANAAAGEIEPGRPSSPEDEKLAMAEFRINLQLSDIRTDIKKLTERRDAVELAVRQKFIGQVFEGNPDDVLRRRIREETEKTDAEIDDLKIEELSLTEKLKELRNE